MRTISNPIPDEVTAPRGLSYALAARRLGISIVTLRRWVASKRLRVMRYSATCVQVPLTEIERMEREALV